MKSRRIVRLAMFAPVVLIAGLRAEEPAWLTDLAEAKRIAAREGKPILVYFTGSTWCGPCKLIHDEVLPSAAFAEFARKHVLVMVDYPPFSERSPEKVKADPALAQRMALKERYRVPGFPTMLILSFTGEEKARKTGYGKGLGAAAYLAGLK